MKITALISMLLLVKSAAALSTNDLMRYDWQSRQCNCKIGQADLQFESRPSMGGEAKMRPSLAGVMYIEMPRSSETNFFSKGHKFQSRSSVLELSPTGNRLRIPMELDHFKLFDNSLGNLRESSIGMNETAVLNVIGFSRVQMIHSRLLIGSLATFIIKEHSVLKTNLASLYLSDDAQFSASYLSQVDFTHDNELHFEMPALTMKWGTEVSVKEHSSLINDQGYILLDPASYMELSDRSKISLGRRSLSIRSQTPAPADMPAKLVLMEASKVIVKRGSHIHVKGGSQLFIARGMTFELSSAAFYVDPASNIGKLVCVIVQPLVVENTFMRLSKPTNTGDANEQRGVMCAKTADELGNKIMNSDTFHKFDLQLYIMDTDSRNPLEDPFHVDPEIPKSYFASDCPTSFP